MSDPTSDPNALAAGAAAVEADGTGGESPTPEPEPTPQPPLDPVAVLQGLQVARTSLAAATATYLAAQTALAAFQDQWNTVASDIAADFASLEPAPTTT